MSARAVTSEYRIQAAPERVLEAAKKAVELPFASPKKFRIEGSVATWESDPDYFPAVERTMRVEADGDGARLSLSATFRLAIPYFGWALAPAVRGSVRSSLSQLARVLESRALRQPEPKMQRPAWASPQAVRISQARAIASVCAILAVTGYGGSLFTQAIHRIGETFGASESDLGVSLAVTRAGTLIGLVGSVLADRRGRRRILLTSLAGVSISATLSAIAPNLVVFSALQVVTRGFINLAAVVGFIVITEESPEGTRAWMLAIASVAAASGFALGVLLLPLAGLHPQAWRALFLLSGLGLLMMRGFRRNLKETQRFVDFAAKGATASGTEIIDPTYGKRFIVVGITGFLLNFGAAPDSQFMNLYLTGERGYSEFDILLLRLLTQGPPALVAVWAGGKLAESKGRRPVAAFATAIAAFATAMFFLNGGGLLWLGSLVASIFGALAGPALVTFNTELFPTEVRGRAGGWLLLIAVAGSIAGLLTSGYLAESIGSVGRAVALTSVGPVIVSLVCIPLLPEARGRRLDDISPSELS